MTPSEPLEIRRCENGFIVSAQLDFKSGVAGSVAKMPNTYVFETMESLQAFIRDHFNTPKPE